MVAASGKDIFEAHLADVMNILREEVAELVRLGATYIQLDAPHYTLFTLLLDPAVRAFYESQGWSVERYLERGIELDNAVIGGFSRAHFRLSPVPGKPREPLAGGRRLRPDRWPHFPAHPRLESVEELVSRIREASRYVPLERLALSPQCGFSTSVVGNALTPADQETQASPVGGDRRAGMG